MAGETENLSAGKPTNGRTASQQEEGAEKAAVCCDLEGLAARVEEEARLLFRQLRGGVDDILETVKKHPGKSLLAALLVGVILGRLGRR
jgi:hypothetical protein